MRPQNKVYQYWCLMVLVLDCTYTAFIVPIGVGFSISDVTLTWAAVCDFVAGRPQGPKYLNMAVGAHGQPLSAQAVGAVHVAGLRELCCTSLQDWG